MTKLDTERLTVPVVGVVLAGGQSRRMGGRDKSFMHMGRSTLIAHVIGRLKPQTSQLIISANGDPDRFADWGLPVIGDYIEKSAGPLAGILSGMLWAQNNVLNCRYIATAATDTPFFPQDLVQRLVSTAPHDEPAIVLAKSEGRSHPVFGLWPVKLAGELRQALALGTRKVGGWAAEQSALDCHFESVSLGGQLVDPFFNINRPEDLRRAQNLIER